MPGPIASEALGYGAMGFTCGFRVWGYGVYLGFRASEPKKGTLNPPKPPETPRSPQEPGLLLAAVPETSGGGAATCGHGARTSKMAHDLHTSTPLRL